MDEYIIHLVKAARRGKMTAFEPLFLQEKEYLYRTAFLYMKNESDAMFGGSENAGEMIVEPDNTDEVQVEEGLVDSVVQKLVTTSDQGLTITVTEYYCAKNSMYLSVEVSSEETVFSDALL